ncbi:hypothetical protein [Oricola indica]|jgi:hypothetical protein|uniref:hypothetical protein n=1 Tax=Oricola indica TaxID=2872591 RepID=UPI001CBD3FF7|nr:hypothetical protein [Oricola indica]
MGIPQHYSHQLAGRCRDILSEYYPAVSKDEGLGANHGGPLSTTLVLALATPMIVLPIERINRRDAGEAHYSNERPVSPMLTSHVDEMMKKNLRDTPFYERLDWRFVGAYPLFNLAMRMDSRLVAALDEQSAAAAAGNMPMTQFVGCLRNALSHGGIMYLDERGQSSDGPASMFAFVSGKTGKHGPLCDGLNQECKHARPPIESLNILRISETDFVEFLYRWAAWLDDAGLSEAMSEEVRAA